MMKFADELASTEKVIILKVFKDELYPTSIIYKRKNRAHFSQ